MATHQRQTMYPQESILCGYLEWEIIPLVRNFRCFCAPIITQYLQELVLVQVSKKSGGRKW